MADKQKYPCPKSLSKDFWDTLSVNEQRLWYTSGDEDEAYARGGRHVRAFVRSEGKTI